MLNKQSLSLFKNNADLLYFLVDFWTALEEHKGVVCEAYPNRIVEKSMKFINACVINSPIAIKTISQAIDDLINAINKNFSEEDINFVYSQMKNRIK